MRHGARRRGRQRHRVAGLAGGAGFAMAVGWMAVAAIRGLFRAVVQGRRLCRVAGMGHLHVSMKVAGLGGYLRRLMLKLAGRHLRGHRVAHPAAQEQQGDQDGEEQMAHG